MKLKLGSYSVSRLLFDITLMLYISSLICVGFVTTVENVRGFDILLLGWMGPLSGNFAWFANLPFAYALVAGKSPAAARVVLFYGFLLALSGFFLKSIPSDAGSLDVIGFGAGYYLWLLCFPTLFASIQLKKPLQSATQK